MAANSGNSPRECGRTRTKSHSFLGKRQSDATPETLRNDLSLSSIIWTLSGARLVCHCKPTQRCHADVLISLFRQTFPAAHDRDQENQPAPTASVLSLLAKLRIEPEEDGGSSADEGVPPKGSGWRGKGQPMMIGSGYVTRELCDGQSLSSPGRWPIHDRAYPKNDKWKRASKVIMDFARVHGTAELLMKLALGQVDKCPFDVNSVSELKQQVVETLQRDGIHMSRTSKDRVDVPIDFLSALLTAAQDPEMGLGDYACGRQSWPRGSPTEAPCSLPCKTQVASPRAVKPTGSHGRRRRRRICMETELHLVTRTVRQSCGRIRGPSEAGPSAEVYRTRSKSTFPQPCGSFAWREPEGQTERHRHSSCPSTRGRESEIRNEPRLPQNSNVP